MNKNKYSYLSSEIKYPSARITSYRFLSLPCISIPAMEATKTELRATRGGEAIQTSESNSCIFHAPYTLVWMDFSGGAIQYGTYDEANRLRRDPCITYDLRDDHEVKYISFGQQHSQWGVTHHEIEKRIVYKQLTSHVEVP